MNLSMLYTIVDLGVTSIHSQSYPAETLMFSDSLNLVEFPAVPF